MFSTGFNSGEWDGSLTDCASCGRRILPRMARPHRQAPEPEAAQHRADAALGQGHIEPRLDHAGQIHPAPANHAL